MENQSLNNNVDFRDDEIDLRELFSKLWRNRMVFVVITVAYALLASGGLAYFTYIASNHVASMDINLEFPGADRGTYPNELPFSSTDIVAAPVLQSVHENLGLVAFGDTSSLRDRLTVQRIESSALQARIRGLEDRLSERNISAAERQAVTREIEEILGGQVSTRYRLRFQPYNGMSQADSIAVLHETLNQWVKDATERLGVMEYSMPVLSSQILQHGIAHEGELFIQTDVLRNAMRELQANIRELERLPGATRLRSAESGLNLAEIQFNLRRVQSYQLEPLQATIRYLQASQPQNRTKDVISAVINDLELRRTELVNRIEANSSSLQLYAQSGSMQRGHISLPGGTEGRERNSELGMINPNFGDSFVELIVQLSGASTDMTFRQRIVERILNLKEQVAVIDRDLEFYRGFFDRTDNIAASQLGNSVSTSGFSLETAERDLALLTDSVIRAFADVQLIYGSLGNENFNAARSLYSVARDVRVERQAPLSQQRLMISVILGYMLVMFVALIGVLLFRRQQH